MKQEQPHIKIKGIVILLGIVLNLLLMSTSVIAQHDGMPTGQHQMPNGQIMDNSAMQSSKGNNTGLIITGVLILIFIAGIWWLAKSTNKSSS